MKYTEEMILQSESGYCMPFEERQGKDVKLSLGYGEQTDPTTGKTYFHHGIDRKSTRLNSSHASKTRMPSSA